MLIKTLGTFHKSLSDGGGNLFKIHFFIRKCLLSTPLFQELQNYQIDQFRQLGGLFYSQGLRLLAQ